jgi:hypothetical protein
MSYKPKGKVVKFLQALESDRFREFTTLEIAAIMGCDQRAVAASLHYPARNGLVFIRKEGKGLRIRGTAYSDQEKQDAARAATDKAIRARRDHAAPVWTPSSDDLRIPRVVPGWTPPVMVAPRG